MSNWSISVVFLFIVVRKGSLCVFSYGCVILDRLSCGCVDRGRVVLGNLGVVGWGSIHIRVVLRYLGGVARGRVSYGIILLCLDGVVLEGLGVVTGNNVSCCCDLGNGSLGVHLTREISVHQ